MSANRCRTCRRLGDAGPCWRCGGTCAKKKRYPSYAQAREALVELRARTGDEDPGLHVYPCPLGVGQHYHVGHAVGDLRKRLLKRAEKQRRKALVKGVLGPDLDRLNRAHLLGCPTWGVVVNCTCPALTYEVSCPGCDGTADELLGDPLPPEPAWQEVEA